ncbi:MAG: proteasome-type protease [Alphaproteobacteria bacterium]|jgi:putative proteasome-type protease|nr:proteasome-type protease [Alphaproteobacteria bacterium]MBU1756607.1 proteasome-type protease [Alphaproteobacteria bacterium]MBU2032685.1 proteasome-type protease [Alphaproteobacteria bacterium]MBU2341646.1 proteasome-type protease [Alphaproteobacteria bacterium]
MTYCVGMIVEKGLVLMSDTRTNSGVDNISVFRKMFHWQVPGDRIITVMTAGNLATTQAVVSQLEERTKEPDQRDNVLLQSPTMFQVASEIGKLVRETIAERQRSNGERGKGRFTASIIVAGQIAGMEPRLFMVYPEGNFIEASADTPFFQIGETKYGRPIILRGYDRSMSMEDAVKLLTVSFDSTLKANLSVGLPLDLMVIERDKFEVTHQRRIAHDDPYFLAISTSWSEALRTAFHSLPDYSFFTNYEDE